MTIAPTYRWTVSPDKRTLRLEGPLSRPRATRRTHDVSLEGGLPDALTGFLDAADNAGEVRFGKRTVIVVQTGLLHAAPTGTLVDLSPQQRRFAQLSRYTKKIEEGINALPEAFVLYDDQDRLLIANPQYTALYTTIADRVRPGVTFDEIASVALVRGQFQVGDDPDAWLRGRLAFHREGVGFFEQHLRDGRWIQVSERRTASGGTTSIRADVTLLKEREQALRLATQAAEATSRSISRFLAIFSHEVRNGLNGMVGIAQMLAFNAREDGEHTKSALLLESTRRLSTVLSDLLEYLKSEATEVSVTVSDVDPRFLLEAIRLEFSRRATDRGLALTVDVAPDVPATVRADPSRIQQVVSNLVSNAIKYSSQGAIEIGLTSIDSDDHDRESGASDVVRLRFTVLDQGIGIASEDIPGLFEFFSRTAPDNPLSTGLGLAISKKLVAAMGGTIGVESHPGQGSRFWFELSLEAVDTSTASDVDIAPVDRTQHLSVGVMDDDPLNRAVAEHLLRQLGHAPVLFDHGDALLTYLKHCHLDALLLDLNMPRESGLQIANRVRTASDLVHQHVAIVAATGNVLSDTIEQSLTAGFDAVLQKPLFLDTLDTTLQSVVARRRLRTVPRPDANDRTAPAEQLTRASSRPARAADVMSDVSSDVSSAIAADVDAQLDGLRRAIGEQRFSQSVRAADRLFLDMHEAIAANAAAALPSLAHRIAGSAAQLGFVALGASARTLESLLHHAPSSDITSSTYAPLLDIIDDHIAAARTILHHYVAIPHRRKRSPRPT